MNRSVKNFAYAVALSGAIAGASYLDVRLSSPAHANEIWTTQSSGQGTGALNQEFVRPDVQALNQTFIALAEKLSPAVVNIYTKTGVSGRRSGPGYPGMPEDQFEFFFREPFGRRPGTPRQAPQAQALGSGFVINQDGYIVTNSHVVRMAGRNADEIMVKFIGEDNGKGHAAKIVGVDEVTDVALLKLVNKKEGLRVAPLGDSDRAKAGEMVIAIGNPYGHTHTVTQGVVSAVGRSLDELGLRSDFIQTSASINPGNSGGPLFNLAGEVIGINTAIDPRAQGIGFAIPVNTAKNVVSQLVASGRVTRGWMGVSIQDLSEDIAGYMKLKESEGVLIREVIPNQPAARAGIEPYDVIRSVNGQSIKNSRELLRQMDKIAIGQMATIEVLRNGQMKAINVRIAEQPKET